MQSAWRAVLTLAALTPLCPCLPVCAQSNLTDTTVLQTVEIIAAPIRQNTTGERQETWPNETLKIHRSNNLGQLLSSQNGVFVKSYGLGSSATTSIRGGSAGHTQVIWNGLPIQNPMLGQLDFSLIPVNFVDQLSVSYGGNTATWGSGAIGGTIFLSNQPAHNEGFRISTRGEIGSFGWWDQQVNLNFGNKKLKQSIRYFHQEAENDFTYFVSSNQPERRQTNAAVNQNGLLHELYWQPTANQQLSTHVWLQETDREIPPRTVQTRSEAKQSDRFIRTSINWKRTGEKSILSARGGLFREEQDYMDPFAGVDSENDFWKAIGEVDQQWQFSADQKLQVGINHTWLQSDAGAYGRTRQQNRSSAFAMFRQRTGIGELQVNVRQELVDDELAPIVPGIGLESQLNDWLLLKSKVTRNYRLPTLNDLYWRPGGNENLRPENGWSEEIGVALNLSKLFKLKNDGNKTYSITAFNRNINDWIQWAVIEGQNFFSPHNITKVWSRGIEQRLNLNYSLNKIKLQINGGHDLIHSTYQEAVEVPRFAKGEQLAFTPVHQWFGSFLIKYKNAVFSYQHKYTGKTGTLNFSELPAYHLGQLYLDYFFTFDKFKLQLFFRTENIWDTDYEVIDFRAMPGRHFRTGLTLELFKKLNNKN